MLGPGLGYRTISSEIVLLPLLPTLYHAFTLPRDHQSRSGSQKMGETASSVVLCQSNAFAIYPLTSASALNLPPHSPTVSNTMRSPPTTTKMTALCGRFAAGVSPPTMLTTTVPPLTTNALSPGVSCPLGTLVQASSAPLPFKTIPMPCVARSLMLT